MCIRVRVWCVCTYLYVHFYRCTRACLHWVCVHVCLAFAYVDSCACICIHAYAISSRMHYCLEKPSPGQVPTFRVMPSSENLLPQPAADPETEAQSSGLKSWTTPQSCGPAKLCWLTSMVHPLPQGHSPASWLRGISWDAVLGGPRRPAWQYCRDD